MHILEPPHRCSKTITPYLPLFSCWPPMTGPQNNCDVKVPALSASPHQLHLRGTPGGRPRYGRSIWGCLKQGTYPIYRRIDGGKVCRTSPILHMPQGNIMYVILSSHGFRFCLLQIPLSIEHMTIFTRKMTVNHQLLLGYQRDVRGLPHRAHHIGPMWASAEMALLAMFAQRIPPGAYPIYNQFTMNPHLGMILAYLMAIK